MPTSRAYLLLLSCQLLGETIRKLSHVPLSGPIIGMILLLFALLLVRGPSSEFSTAGQSLLRYLSLLFVPPGVGVMQHLPLLRERWFAIVLAVFVSTILAMVSGALTMQSVNLLWRQCRRVRQPTKQYDIAA